MGRGQELLDASREGDKRNVEKILGQITKRSGPFTSLRRGAGVNVQDHNGYTALHHACLHGHKEIVRLLLSVYASPCMLDNKGATPLHLAAFKGDSEIVAMLLACNNPPVNIDQLTYDNESALLIAAQFESENVVAQLTAQGADVTIRNNNGESALDLAAQYGRVKTVEHLLRVMPQLVDDYKAPSSKSKIFPNTPLHRASKNGRKEVVTALLAAGVDPNVRTYSGTALHEAACFGKASVVRILLKNGADLNAQDKRGKTVLDLLAEYSEEATRKVRKVIREYECSVRPVCDSEEDLPPFPVNDYMYGPTHAHPTAIMNVPETQKNTNTKDSLLSSSSSSLTKNHAQSFVKKLASKCLGLKAKFNSAPNISNNAGPESDVDVKFKHLEQKSSVNTLHIGNSKFFKILSKKEESGEIVCTDEFDTISLDRLGSLNRVSVVNRSNRSCPGFKTSLPNISENIECDSHESVAEPVVNEVLNCNNNNESWKLTEAVNINACLSIFEPRTNVDKISVEAEMPQDSENFDNECYESYEFFKNLKCKLSAPKPVPRPNTNVVRTNQENVIYENITFEKSIPKPAKRSQICMKSSLDELHKSPLYENVSLKQDNICPKPPKRTIVPFPDVSTSVSKGSSISRSRSSTISSDSMVDESNLEDILLSTKSKSFRNGNVSSLYNGSDKSNVFRSRSIESDFSDMTEVSAIENVDCTGENDIHSKYLSMSGTLPNKSNGKVKPKRNIFRHKTFTNIELDKNSTNIKDLPDWNDEFLKETLANYHIRGTGHCIYKAPTVQEFIYIFNRETLYDTNVIPFTKIANEKRDSYYETAICFCRPRPPKHHNSAEDLLEISHNQEEEVINIDINALQNRREMTSTSFRCFCDSGTCKFHSLKREAPFNLVIKFSAIKKSISSPNITLVSTPSSTEPVSKLVSDKVEDPYAVVNVDDIIARSNNLNKEEKRDEANSSIYVPMSQPSTLTSSSSARPYSLKDISEVISLNEHSTSTTSSLSSASDTVHLLRKSTSSEYSEHWSLQSCNSNVTIKSDASFKTCIGESSDDDSDSTLHSDEDISDAETVKSDVSTSKRPWVHSDSFRFGSNDTKYEIDAIAEESHSDKGSDTSVKYESLSSKFESGISVEGSESSSSGDEDDSGVPRVDRDVSLETASLERGSGVVGDVRSGSGRRRWDEAEGTSEGDALSVSSAASSCAPLHLVHHQEYSKVSPTPPKKPPRRNLSVSPTHANSPSSGYSYELRPHARSQDDLDDIPGAKHYLKHGRSVDQYVDGKLSYSEYEENHNSPRVAPVPNPRPSLKNRSQPVAITAMYENVVIKEQNPRRKLRRNNFVPSNEGYEQRMNDNRVRKYSNQERSSLESLLDDQSMNSPSDCERYYDGPRLGVPLSPTHYDQPPTPDHPPPSARQAEASIHERIRPLSQLIMEVVEEIRIRKKSQGDVTNS